MRIEKHQEVAKLYMSRLHILYPSPALRDSTGFHRVAAPARVPPESSASKPAQSNVLRPELFPSRCRHKGCVFPAQPGGRGECAYHRRQALEPGCFQSLQPSFLLLDRAKFGLPDSEPDDGRVRDRNRLAAERMQFMLGDAA